MREGTQQDVLHDEWARVLRRGLPRFLLREASSVKNDESRDNKLVYTDCRLFDLVK